MDDYDIVKRTFTTKDGREIIWNQTKVDENYSKLSWIERFAFYLKSIKVDSNNIRHSHKTEYIKYGEV